MQQAVKGVTGVLTSGLFGGPKGKGVTGGITPGEGMIGGQDLDLGVDLNTFDGIDLSGVIANNDTIAYNNDSGFGFQLK